MMTFHPAPNSQNLRRNPPAPGKPKAELEALEMMLKHGVLPGQAWHAYENKDLGSPQVGHLKFVKCGVACTLLTPPESYPHDSMSQGRMYRHIGTVDMVTGEITL